MKSVGWNITYFIVAIMLSGLASAESFVPFVIPADTDSNSQILLPYSSVTEQNRLSAKDHFYSSHGRVRLWGVNFTFEANFPTHADARQIALRLACAGINSVRMHHMDTMNWPRGIWNSDGKTLNPEALDRLDYFIEQLSRHGIYIDLNLHVGKEYSKILGFPDVPETHNKMVSIFTPQIIEAQKDYARQLLTHQNKYRPWRYADDPAIAIVEITNENSLFMWSAERLLPALPEFYADILRQKYNQWLKTKYGTTEKLAAAWSADSIPLGPNLLLNNDLKIQSPDQAAPDNWRLEQHETAKAKVSRVTYIGRDALRIEPLHIDGIEWHLQLNQGNLGIQADKIYTVTLQIAADKDCSVNLGLIQAESPWKNLGLYKSININKKWKQVRLTFTAAQSETNSRFNLTFGKNQTPFYIASISLQQGAEFKLEPDESLEKFTVKVFGNNEFQSRQLDRMIFLAETEKAFFDGMRNYLQKDLGCKAMITGTIVFGPLGLYAQSDMDFIDSHAYWQHPRWPNKPWDPKDWLIDQKSMADYPKEATLFKLAAERLADKPFTVTEYNHPAPLDSQAECIPIIASFAAMQDWDGVWLYTYSHRNNDWNRDFMNSYFDIDTNPAKWGFLPSGSLIFKRGAFCNSHIFETFITTEQPLLETLSQIHLNHGMNMTAGLSKPPMEYLNLVLSRNLQTDKKTWQTMYRCPPDARTNWYEGFYFADSMYYCAAVGHAECFEDGKITGTRIGPDDTTGSIRITAPQFAAVTIVSMDSYFLRESKKILITACGRCENTDMKFSDDRRTVGTDWGKGPVRIEAVDGTIVLPLNLKNTGTQKCFALNPNGTKKTEVPMTDGKVELSAKYGTMWYLIEK